MIEAAYIEEISGQIDIITNVVERNNDGAQNSAASSQQLSLSRVYLWIRNEKETFLEM